MKMHRFRSALLGGVLTIGGIAVYLSFQSASSIAMAEKPTPSTSQGVAVVELFTSEGCSSCPPADLALQQISEVAAKNDLPVHVLSFHVDYWNRLGWTDPFSDPGYTRRQQSYAGVTGSSRVYTPQMIVNGTTEFVGSNRAKANAAIPKALQQSARTKIKLVQNATVNGWTISYEVEGSGPDDVLNLAVVETPDVTHVARGENAGRKLHHINVVRRFESVPLDVNEGQKSLTKPENFQGKDSQIIAYVQNPRTGQVTGASAIKL